MEGTIYYKGSWKELIKNKGEQSLERAIAKIENLVSFKNTHDMTWELTFQSEKDMRPAVFDFATENGLKTLQLNQKNKNLEAIFREITK